MNKIRGAFAVPRKGETFELRAGLVYDTPPHFENKWQFSRDEELMMLIMTIGPSMPMNGMLVFAELATNAMDGSKEQRGEADGSYRKESIQKTIMAMTLGKDVSALFPDVLKNIATADLEQKKLVYLYLM